MMISTVVAAAAFVFVDEPVHTAWSGVRAETIKTRRGRAVPLAQPLHAAI
jgi:hypothetical protein